MRVCVGGGSGRPRESYHHGKSFIHFARAPRINGEGRGTVTGIEEGWVGRTGFAGG